jgi:hypothetical protein
MRAGTWRELVFVGILLCVFPAKRSEAVNPEKLFMPGELSAAHQKLEEQCSNCHDRSNRGRERQLCLDCHKPIAADLSAHRGFHGHLQAIESSQCRACHVEHQGRTADIVKLSREQFNHDSTDFPLHGAHLNLTCSSCHQPGKAFRDASHECAVCHKAQEPHEGKLGRDCAACHDTKVWQHVTFDHDKTSFPLHDKHQSVRCVECHFGNRYKGTPSQCVSCHAPDDVHRGERGPKCASCHSTSGWKSSRFDHAKETGFALEGAHSHLDCQDCHRSGNLQDKLPKECIGCHQGQDVHAGRMGTDCARCHKTQEWRTTTFDHTRDGGWALAGKHVTLDCHACHTAALGPRKLPTDCVSCHRASDVHGSRLGTACDECHLPESWKSVVNFDHDLTKFPLLGLHVAVPCEQCHTGRTFRITNPTCAGCHKDSDVHKGSLGKECAQCHSPNSWRMWEFDHGKQTGFALAGAHSKLGCAACHKQPAAQVKLDRECVSCHSQDDVHLGQYGGQCQKCHSTLSFKGARRR